MTNVEARASIPKWHEFIEPVIRVLADGQPKSLQDIYRDVADRVGLSDEAKAEVTPSARQPVYWNRIGWAISRSKGAGLLASPARATYALTEDGRRHAAGGAPLTEATLREYPVYREWIASFAAKTKETDGSAPNAEVEQAVAASATPAELLDTALDQINASLEERVYAALLEIEDPYTFERIVTEFVARLGYGDEYEVTARSGDLGIDGVVLRDKLGLERVYVQAKRYAEGNTVSAEAVRAFIGSLGLHRASVGVMITTSSFARTSHLEVERTHSTNVRLIDGRELARLMVKHTIGVSVDRVIEVKRLDTDLFFAAAEGV